MLRAGRGDHAAFAELYTRYERPIYNFFYRLCFSRERSEEFLQEVYLRLWKHAPRYRPTAKFTTYLFQIAKNYWLNQRGKLARERQQASLDSPVVLGDGGSPGAVGDLVASEDQDPGAAAADREAVADLRAAVERLDERQKLVFVFSEYHHFTYPEIAAILEIPLGTVKTRMYYAVRRLRETLAAHAPQPRETHPNA